PPEARITRSASSAAVLAAASSICPASACAAYWPTTPSAISAWVRAAWRWASVRSTYCRRAATTDSAMMPSATNAACIRNLRFIEWLARNRRSRDGTFIRADFYGLPAISAGTGDSFVEGAKNRGPGRAGAPACGGRGPGSELGPVGLVDHRGGLRAAAGRARGLGLVHRARHGHGGRRGGRGRHVQPALQPEHRDGLGQAGGLFLHRAGRGGGFLDQGRVLLGGLVHLHDGLVDLLDARRLLLRGGRDLGHDVGHALHRGHDLAHGLAG